MEVSDELRTAPAPAAPVAARAQGAPAPSPSGSCSCCPFPRAPSPTRCPPRRPHRRSSTPARSRSPRRAPSERPRDPGQRHRASTARRSSEAARRSVPELLRREAGIMVTSLGTTPEGYTVEARGFNNGGGNGCATLVLVDGRRLNEPETGCPDWSFVALEEIDRIEIVRGPASVAYGDNAAAGVIQIFTRRAREDGMRTASRTLDGQLRQRRTPAVGLVDGRHGTASPRGPIYDDADSNGYRDQSGLRGRLECTSASASTSRDGRAAPRRRLRQQPPPPPGRTHAGRDAAEPPQADPDSLGDVDQARARFLLGPLELPADGGRDAPRRCPTCGAATDLGARSRETTAPAAPSTSRRIRRPTSSARTRQVEVGFDAFGRRHTFLAGGRAAPARTATSDNLFSSLPSATPSPTCDCAARPGVCSCSRRSACATTSRCCSASAATRSTTRRAASRTADFGIVPKWTSTRSRASGRRGRRSPGA